MMNSYRPNKPRRRSRLFAATLLVVVLFGIDVLSHGALRARVRSLTTTLSQSIGGVGNRIMESGAFSSRAALEAQNQSLTEALAQYQERAAQVDVLEAENEQLRSFTHLAQTAPGVTAPVISSIRSSPYGTFLIGAGSEDGIARGNLVLTSGGFVVGTVSDTAAHTAVVSELFAPGAALDASIEGIPVSLSGSGGGNAHTTVARGLAVATGDPVSAASFSQRPVGIVGEIASSSASASQEVYIRLPVNLGSLQFVYVTAAH